MKSENPKRTKTATYKRMQTLAGKPFPAFWISETETL